MHLHQLQHRTKTQTHRTKPSTIGPKLAIQSRTKITADQRKKSLEREKPERRRRERERRRRRCAILSRAQMPRQCLQLHKQVVSAANMKRERQFLSSKDNTPVALSTPEKVKAALVLSTVGKKTAAAGVCWVLAAAKPALASVPPLATVCGTHEGGQW